MVGKNIKKFRERKGLTQDEVAERLNVTRQTVSCWETEKSQPDIETLQSLSQIFEVSVEELIYGKERKFTTIVENKTVQNVTKGLSFGSALAMVISYVTWKSIGWAILHGVLGWVYVIYFAIKY